MKSNRSNHIARTSGVSASVAALTIIAAMLAVTPTPSLSADSARTQRPGKAFSAQATADRVAQTLRTGRSSGAPVELADPPIQAPGELMAWDDLRRSLDAVDRWLAEYEARTQRAAPFARLARASQRAAAEAHKAMVQVHTDFAAGLGQLDKAVRLMAVARHTVRRQNQNQEAAWATQVMKEFTAAASRLAADGLQRARAGGVNNQLLNAAAHAYQDGLALMARGNYGQAFGQFAPSITVGSIPVFDLDRFEMNLNDAFELQTVGYQYAIARDGALVRTSVYGTTGLARTNENPPNTSQVATKEMNIASISKTITAMVLLRLLDERNLSVDSPIAPWLPASWALGAGIGPVPGSQQLSFRDLLTHRSGLNANLNLSYRYSNLQNYAEAGILPADKLVSPPVYQNANFAMFRIAIPYLRYGADVVNLLESLLWFAPFDEVIAGLYIETVRDYAFAPTGFVQGGCVASDPTPTLGYPFPANGQPGIQPGDWIDRCGSGGWYLSSVELLGVMATRRFTNLILSPASRQLMDFNYLGWRDPDFSPTAKGLYGNYRHHGGDLTVSGPLGACYMEFFNGVQVVVNINSDSGNYVGFGNNQCAAVKWAFENAFIAP